MGTGQVLQTATGDHVHGHALKNDERKMLVHKCYTVEGTLADRIGGIYSRSIFNGQ